MRLLALVLLLACAHKVPAREIPRPGQEQALQIIADELMVDVQLLPKVAWHQRAVLVGVGDERAEFLKMGLAHVVEGRPLSSTLLGHVMVHWRIGVLELGPDVGMGAGRRDWHHTLPGWWGPKGVEGDITAALR